MSDGRPVIVLSGDAFALPGDRATHQAAETTDFHHGKAAKKVVRARIWALHQIVLKTEEQCQ